MCKIIPNTSTLLLNINCPCIIRALYFLHLLWFLFPSESIGFFYDAQINAIIYVTNQLILSGVVIDNNKYKFIRILVPLCSAKHKLFSVNLYICTHIEYSYSIMRIIQYFILIGLERNLNGKDIQLQLPQPIFASKNITIGNNETLTNGEK